MKRAALALGPAMAVGLLLGWVAPARAAPDPLEPLNRQIHAMNAAAQARVLSPLAEAWRRHVPEDTRRGLGSAVGNLGEPVSALGFLAAGETGTAWHAARRFGINSTQGWGGWRDVAAERGLVRQAITPGEALCARGVPSGPYLVLPLLGPSTLRDAAAGTALAALLAKGLGAEAVAGLQGAEAFLTYDRLAAELGALEARSLDPYAVLRSAHAQRRAQRCAADQLPEEE
jgi:phospholipid-binding lipoprotein MlaA